MIIPLYSLIPCILYALEFEYPTFEELLMQARKYGEYPYSHAALRKVIQNLLADKEIHIVHTERGECYGISPDISNRIHRHYELEKS